MRGMLICPFLVEIAMLDPIAMDAVDPPGPATTGFDTLFNEPHLEGPNNGGKPIRRELETVSIPAQIEDEAFEMLHALEAGDTPSTLIQFTMHFRDLESMSLVNAAGMATFRKGDRLVSIRRMDGQIILTPRVPIYIKESRPEGFALSLRNSHRNLLTVVVGPRPAAVRARTA